MAAFWRETLYPALQVVGQWLEMNLLPVLETLWNWIGAVLPPVIQGLADIWKNVLWPSMKAVWTLLSEDVFPILQAVAEVVSAVLNVAFQVLGELLTKIILPVLQRLNDLLAKYIAPVLQRIGNYLIDTFKPAFDKAGGAVSALVGHFGGLQGIVDAVVGALQRLADKIRNLPKLNLPSIPGLGGGAGNNASGTSFWRGGLSWVGENGPELVNLPRGSRVYPAEQSRAMTGASWNITVNVIGGGDPQATGRAVERGVLAAARAMGAA
jgi:hypothetical protein